MSKPNRDHLFTYYRALMRPASFLVTLILPAVLCLAILGSATPAGAATREECKRCCDTKGYDEYYLEQCKLKCYRDPNHCKPGRASRSKPTVAPEKKKKKKKKKRKRRRKKITLRFPSPLNITPGEEWRTAVEICVFNGITSRHPKYVEAVRRIEAILQQFARSNPQGGELPTTQLERAIVRYK